MSATTLDEAKREAQAAIDVIYRVEARCMASDGPVTPTLKEMTEAEMRQIYKRLCAITGGR